jgi:hypothetical protein
MQTPPKKCFYIVSGTILAITLLIAIVPAWSEQGEQGDKKPRELVGSTLGLPGKLGKSLAQTPVGKAEGHIALQARKGFAGIPGAPKINYLVAFLWAIWVGWIFSTVGAFGGIMAGVGHLTILGLGAYASSFKDTNPALNALLTDTIRASNQYLVALSSLISVLNFYRMRRIVLPLGIALGLGSITGSLIIPLLTAGKINLHQYIGYFGLVVLIIGGFIYYGTTSYGQKRKKKSQEASEVFQKSIKEKSDSKDQGVRIHSLTLTRVQFSFFGIEFNFNPILPVIGGGGIAALSSFLGIGGGFLYVPFMTSIVGLPMFLVAGTSALAVFLSMLVSIFSYVVVKGTFINWSLVGIEMVGVFTGAMIGPRTQKYIPDIWLRRLFVLLAIYVGIRYFSKGFFGQSWIPPF